MQEAAAGSLIQLSWPSFALSFLCLHLRARYLILTQRRDLSDNSWVSKLQPWIEVMLANYRDIWERDYAHLALHKKGEEERRL
jgi:hypothetical protein